VQEQPKLVGLPAMTGGAVGFGVGFVILDHVFHPAPGTINLLVKHPGPARKVGNNEADVAALRGRFDTGDDLAHP